MEDAPDVIIRNAVREIISAMGHSPLDPHFSDTPRRFEAALAEFNCPLDLKEVLNTDFALDEPTNGRDSSAMVMQQHIPFAGLCPHHLMPFFGTAAIGYLPQDRIVGLSKLTRLVTAAGRCKPATQESITDAIADTMDDVLRPKGVIVVTSAMHSCMSVRGPRAPGVKTTASSVRGLFLHVPAVRAEFLSLLEKAHD